MYKILKMMVIFVLIISLILPNIFNIDSYAEPETIIEEAESIPDAEVEMVEYIPDAEVEMVKSTPIPTPSPRPMVAKKTKSVRVRKKVKVQPKKYIPTKPSVSEQDIKLLALLCMAEAEGESERGKRLVIDTVLNRVDSKQFPNSISGVIYQKNQFSSMWNGRVNRCYVKDDIYRLVKDELCSRTNSQVMFFTAGRYSDYGTPMFIEGNHYFSKY